jgi:hypothetical protein
MANRRKTPLRWTPIVVLAIIGTVLAAIANKGDPIMLGYILCLWLIPLAIIFVRGLLAIPELFRLKREQRDDN